MKTQIGVVSLWSVILWSSDRTIRQVCGIAASHQWFKDRAAESETDLLPLLILLWHHYLIIHLALLIQLIPHCQTQQSPKFNKLMASLCPHCYRLSHAGIIRFIYFLLLAAEAW